MGQDPFPLCALKDDSRSYFRLQPTHLIERLLTRVPSTDRPLVIHRGKMLTSPGVAEAGNGGGGGPLSGGTGGWAKGGASSSLEESERKSSSYASDSDIIVQTSSCTDMRKWEFVP